MVGLVGKHKLADKWRREVYVVLRQPNPAIPVFVVQEEGGIGPKKTLHRNMLLSLDAIPPQDINPRIRNPPKSSKKSAALRVKQFKEAAKTSDEDDDDDDENDYTFLLPRTRRWKITPSSPRYSPPPELNHQQDSVEEAQSVPVSEMTSTDDLPTEPHSICVSVPASSLVEECDATSLIDTSSSAAIRDPTTESRVSSRSQETSIPEETEETTVSGRPTRNRRPPAWIRDGNWVTNFRTSTTLGKDLVASDNSEEVFV
jgi:hypothetical protein